jgi:lysozyme
MTDPAITMKDAERYAWHELDRCVAAAIQYSPCLADDPARLASIASFIYNLGHGAYRGSTLRKRINVEDWDGAKVQIVRWNKAGGRVLRGLTRRREAEAALL